MKIVKITTGVLSVNTFLLINEESRECVVIDSGEDYQAVKRAISDLGVTAKYLLYTHAHFDHIGNAHLFQKDGLKAYISDIDKEKLSNGEHLGFNFRRAFNSFIPDKTFSGGEELDLCGIKIKVLLTPGHTTGSVCFIVENNIFSGDTLFKDSIGRTDFPTGDYNEIERSIKTLYKFQGDFNVYAGHGEDTTLSRERKYNMFIRENG